MSARASVEREPFDLDDVPLPPRVWAPRADSWPLPMGEAAYHSVFGDITRALAPQTEADPHAILVQLLTMYGSIIGRSAHFRVENDRHFTNLFAVVVGASGKARKGVSRRQAQGIFSAVDDTWVRDHIASGLSSGEGLLYAVRDAISKQEPIKEKGRVIDYQTVIEDPGVEDKRLMVFEEEFASVLKVMGREGSTLSTVVRQLWDGHDTIRTMTKGSPICATRPHVSIVGHITREELRRELTATESANGFGNRYVWLLARRSQALPDGGAPVDLAPLLPRVAAAVAHGRQTGEIGRDRAAAQFWRRIYARLSDGRPGLLGALTARGEAQVMRFACLYALADGESIIRMPHLLAGLEVWRYCFDSARLIFGESLGDQAADDILGALHLAANGLTRSAIQRDVFSGNRRGVDIGRALVGLETSGLARRAIEPSTGGRPGERWFPAEAAGERQTPHDIGALVALAAGLGSDERNEFNELSPAGTVASSARGLNTYFVASPADVANPTAEATTAPLSQDDGGHDERF